MRKVWTFLAPSMRPLVVLSIYGLIVCAYAYSSFLADLGDTVIGPPVVQEALRAYSGAWEAGPIPPEKLPLSARERARQQEERAQQALREGEKGGALARRSLS